MKRIQLLSIYIISNQYLSNYLTTMGVVFLDGDNAMAILGTLLEPYKKFIVSFNGQNTLIL
jgi:hypothetical protein